MVVCAPVAYASPSYTISGGCFFDTSSQAPVTNGDYVGGIGDLSVTQDKATQLPVSATVSCKIAINGLDGPIFSSSDIAPGVQVGADQVSFTASDTDVVQLCQKVEYNGLNGFETDPWDCQAQTTLPFPPPVVYDAINDLMRTLEPLTCATFAGLAGDYGGVIIESDGDVIVSALGNEPINDCPPYGA